MLIWEHGSLSVLMSPGFTVPVEPGFYIKNGIQRNADREFLDGITYSKVTC